MLYQKWAVALLHYEFDSLLSILQEIKFNLKATKFCCIGSYDKQNLKLVILYEIYELVSQISYEMNTRVRSSLYVILITPITWQCFTKPAAQHGECQILWLVINLRVSLPHYSDRKNNVINSATFNMHDLGAFRINQWEIANYLYFAFYLVMGITFDIFGWFVCQNVKS